MSADLKIATGAIDVGGWRIKDADSSTRITIIDKTGRAVASVPRRADDLDIARLIEIAPDMLEVMRVFCARCERGEILSKKTYAKFKAIIGKVQS